MSCARLSVTRPWPIPGRGGGEGEGGGDKERDARRKKIEKTGEGRGHGKREGKRRDHGREERLGQGGRKGIESARLHLKPFAEAKPPINLLSPLLKCTFVTRPKALPTTRNPRSTKRENAHPP
jgi:hypothetical protein